MPPAPVHANSSCAKDRPVGGVFWARTSAEVAARLAKSDKRMRPGDWRSGDETCVVDVVAPFEGAEEMVRDCTSSVD